MAGLGQAGLGAMFTKLDFICGTGESLQGLNRVAQSEVKAFQEWTGPHASISLRWALQEPSCNSLERANDWPDTAGGRGIEMWDGASHCPLYVSFLLTCAFLASYVQVCSLPT